MPVKNRGTKITANQFFPCLQILDTEHILAVLLNYFISCLLEKGNIKIESIKCDAKYHHVNVKISFLFQNQFEESFLTLINQLN